MSTYRERRQARAERLRTWAESRDRKADAARATSDAITEHIPFGQPILVGHHSETADRNRRGRAEAAFGRSMEHQAKADAFRAKADNIEAAAAAAIYDDDPDAVDRLRDKLADLEAQRDRIKRYNATCRKGAPDPTILDDQQRSALASVLRHAPYQSKAGAFQGYALSNLSGRIAAARKRLARLTG